jgi:xyloglucan-specific endo-beta-1,4-glucanase
MRMSSPFSRYVPRFFLIRSALIILALIVTLSVFLPKAKSSWAAQANSCQAYASLTMGKYWLNNNLWGQKSGSGQQCILDKSISGSAISWSTNWNWTGQSNAVKSFASAVLGWHWGTKVANTGLPIQLSEQKNVNTSWKFRVTQQSPNTLDVSYDLWFHTISNPTYNSTPTDELMVWLYHSGGAGPVGTRKATVKIDGASWDLYEGNIGWNVFSFVRTKNTTSAKLNLKDFFQNLISTGSLSSSKYLSSIEAGTEIFIGNGQLNTTSYSVNIR